MWALYFSLIVGLQLAVGSADWSGEYQDNTFGGLLSVCLSDVTESDSGTTTVGQGMFSRFGYMRGVVSGNQWEGEFFMAGLEARRGSFNFTLNDNGMSYSGTFAEAVGYSYGMSGNKVSEIGYVPKDTDCFKTDISLLTKNVQIDLPYSYTSRSVSTNIASGATQDTVSYSDDSNHVSVSWTASFGIGFNYGPSFLNGQVVCAQWYEGNAKEGIQLFVAKDLSSFYSIWLISSSVSVFNYTQVVVLDKSYGVEINEIIDTDIAAEEGREFSFLRLLTSTDESTCEDALAGDSLNCDDSENDDDNQVLTLLMIALIIVGCANFAVLIYLKVCLKQKGCGTNSEIDKDMKTTTISTTSLPSCLSES